jgi:hypothetical protein
MVFSLFGWLAALFSGGRKNPERARKRGLKRTAQAITANVCGAFFRTKSFEATPDMAQFFYGICKAVSPARAFLQNLTHSTQLKISVAAGFLDRRQLDMLERMSAESIEKRAEETEASLLSRQIQGEFAELERSFDLARTSAINECYSLALIVCKFMAYDYYALLKKFDPRLIELDFGGKPAFSALRGEAVVEDLKDFLELTAGLDPGRDWSAPLRILNEITGTEAITPDAWKSLLLTTRTVVNSGIFELIIRFVENDPDWAWRPSATQENLAGFYLELIRSEVFGRLALVLAAQWNALIDRRVRALFGNTRINRLNYYTEQAGELCMKKKLPGFADAKALNYLMTFLVNEKKELQDLYELVLVRGHWISTALSFPLSEALWLLTVFPARITALDEMFSEWGRYGVMLKRAAGKAGRDGSQWIARSLNSANDEARQIVNDAIFTLSILNNGLKDLGEDYRKNPGSIILNWDKLNAFSENGLEERILALRNKLTTMLELLGILIRITNYE